MTDEKKKYNLLILEISIVLACILLFFTGMAWSQGFGLKDFFLKTTHALYVPHYNTCRVGKIGNLSFYRFLYYLILFAYLILEFARRILKKYGQSHFPSNRIVLLTVLSSLLLMQAVSHGRYFFYEYLFYEDQTTSQKYTKIYLNLFRFPNFCKEILPGKHAAELRTDLDIREDDIFYYHIVLSYFLYPIDMKPNMRQKDYRLDNPEPADCLLVFWKSNPMNIIPPDFKVKGVYNPVSLVAVKKAAP